VAVEALMSRAFAYADGREADQAPPLAAEDRDVGTGSIPTVGSEAASPVPAPSAEQAVKPSVVVAAPAAAAVPAMDPQLHEIYSKEVSSHLAEIRDYLNKRAGLPAPHELPESVYRAIHTLSGSSKMAEARHGIRITEPLNHYMRKVFDSGRGMSAAALVVLADAVRSIDNVVSHINESTAFFAEQPSLLERLAGLEAELDAELATVIETSASAIVPQLAQPVDAPAPAPAGSAPASLARVPQEPPAAPDAPGPAADEFDHEIANIYCEEATELIEAAELSLTAWNRDRKDKQPVAELQRTLHTLKGGARMAGISAMGDLSHELETLVIGIDGGLVTGDDHAHAVMQASLDELARMRDLVSTGVLPTSAQALLAQIRNLSSGVAPSDARAAPPLAAAPAAAGPRPVPAAPSLPSQRALPQRLRRPPLRRPALRRSRKNRSRRSRCPRNPSRSWS